MKSTFKFNVWSKEIEDGYRIIINTEASTSDEEVKELLQSVTSYSVQDDNEHSDLKTIEADSLEEALLIVKLVIWQ